MAGFVPPPSPLDDAEAVQRFYQENLLGIRVGMVICIFSSAMLLPWDSAICAQMLRMEGPRAPLTWAWVAAQGCVVIEFMYPCAFWPLTTCAVYPYWASCVLGFQMVALATGV